MIFMQKLQRSDWWLERYALKWQIHPEKMMLVVSDIFYGSGDGVVVAVVVVMVEVVLMVMVVGW